MTNHSPKTTAGTIKIDDTIYYTLIYINAYTLKHEHAYTHTHTVKSVSSTCKTNTT